MKRKVRSITVETMATVGLLFEAPDHYTDEEVLGKWCNEDPSVKGLGANSCVVNKGTLLTIVEEIEGGDPKEDIT